MRGLIYIKMPSNTQRMMQHALFTMASHMFLKPLHIGFCCLMLSLLAAPLPVMGADEEATEESDGDALSDSGLPIPRFVTLKFEEVNLRTGPGRRYPIRWVYKRKHMPMEVVEEFGHWRKIRDEEGDEGWAHKSQLSGNRIAVFKADSVLKRYPEADAPPMIKVQKGVLAQLLECNMDWCEVQVESYKSWTEKDAIWGVYRNETL